MWLEESRGTRINHMRTDHFLKTDADTVGVSCPFCLHMRTDHFLETDADTVGVSCPFCLQLLTEGIGAKGLSGQKQAKDILELWAESLGTAS